MADDEHAPDPLVVTEYRRTPVFSLEDNLIKVNMTFRTKRELKESVSRYSLMVHNREHVVTHSDEKRWIAVCKHRGADNCRWRVHASRKSLRSLWEVRKLVPNHVCQGINMSPGHANVSCNMIAASIRHLVEDNPMLTMKTVIATAEEHFGCGV